MPDPTTPEPVGYYCDHSDEPFDARTHEGWEHTDEGAFWGRTPSVITSHQGVPDDGRLCPRAVPVFTAEQVRAAVAAEMTRLREDLQARIKDHDMAAKFAGERIGLRSPLPVVTAIGCVKALAMHLEDIVEREVRAKVAAEIEAEGERIVEGDPLRDGMTRAAEIARGAS